MGESISEACWAWLWRTDPIVQGWGILFAISWGFFYWPVTSSARKLIPTLVSSRANDQRFSDGELPVACDTAGWALVDVNVEGQSFRFVSTHLESFLPGVQLAQVNQLFAGPLKTDLPVVLVGDFNAVTFFQQTATYAHITAAGFTDAWAVAGFGAGFTCCQQEDLCNATSRLSSRIDLVFFNGRFSCIDVDIVGEDPLDRVVSEKAWCGSIWPSDHAGVVATLELE